ncbi:MAG: hypothetical protein ACRD2E_14420 [Terriglobales bacterium]
MMLTLMDASPFDRARARRRNQIIVAVIIAVIIAVGIYWYWPYYRARQTVNHFMTAIVQGNYQEAYAIWQADPKEYSMDSFMQDWGPSSPYGVIKTYKIQDVTEPPGGNSSGLVVLVRVNGIHTDARLWVQSNNQEMSFYQF